MPHADKGAILYTYILYFFSTKSLPCTHMFLILLSTGCMYVHVPIAVCFEPGHMAGLIRQQSVCREGVDGGRRECSHREGQHYHTTTRSTKHFMAVCLVHFPIICYLPTYNNSETNKVCKSGTSFMLLGQGWNLFHGFQSCDTFGHM